MSVINDLHRVCVLTGDNVKWRVIARPAPAAGFPSTSCGCKPPSCRAEQEKRRRAADMADYSSVAPPSSNAGGGMNDAFKDALQRARQVRRAAIHFRPKIMSKSGTKSRVSPLSAVPCGVAGG